MKISSDRLHYTPLSLSHLNDFYTIDSDPEVMKYYRQGASPDPEISIKNIQSYIDYANRHPGLGAYAVHLKATNEFVGIGVVIHMDKNPDHKDYEIGYRLNRNHWGKGYATEIAHALVDYCYQHLKLAEVYGTTNPENLVSQKVLEKVGFKYVGDGTFHGGCKIFKLSISTKDK